MTAFVGMGGNIGDPRQNLRDALDAIAHSFRILRKSSLYRTAAVGGPEGQPDCYNAVIEIEPGCEPASVLDRLHAMEREMGRVREEKWGPRIIDLDLLDQDGIIITEDDLILPHPMMHERSFVLAPLCEIAPQWKHPTIQYYRRKMR